MGKGRGRDESTLVGRGGSGTGGGTGLGGRGGVQDLDRVLFDRPYVEVLGASPAGVLYKVSRADNLPVATWVKPAGRLLPKASYTWTLAGRDGDGTLRWWTGTTHAIAGTVKIG